MHHVQSHILEVLTFTEFARFRDMRPPKVDTNLYSYHLKALQKEDYLEKGTQGYTLTPKGLSYVDGLSFDGRTPRKQPKIVAIFALQNGKGEWLMSRRKIQPYIGQFMLPSGKQHYGESPQEHIERELQEQLGVVPVVKRRGFADVRIQQEGETITHVNGHVYSGTYDGPLPADTRKFSYEFRALGDEIMVERTTDIIDAIKSGEPFFLSFTKAAA
jgi:ADP-ribose pyrophosphatase YjhB (NUDIX family)